MFTLLSNLRKYVAEKRERSATFVLVGLDNAGKTTVVKALQGQVVRDTRPTVGFQRGNQFKVGNFMLKMSDLGGGAKIRKIWDSYYAEVHGVVYVVDAADAERLDESRQCLQELMADERIAGKPILLFANKQDLPGALGAAELSERLGLNEAAARGGSHNIVACQALPDEGVETVDARLGDGMSWLLGSAKKQWKDLSERVERQCAERDEIERVKREEKRARVAKMKAERAAAKEAEAAAAAQADAAEKGAGSAGSAEGAEAGSKPASAASSPGKVEELLPGQIAIDEGDAEPAAAGGLPPLKAPPPPKGATPEPQP